MLNMNIRKYTIINQKYEYFMQSRFSFILHRYAWFKMKYFSTFVSIFVNTGHFQFQMYGLTELWASIYMLHSLSGYKGFSMNQTTDQM